MDDSLQLRLFGPPTITIGHTSLTVSLPAKAQAILFFLAVTGQPQPRLTLASLLWGDVPESAARANLRRALVDLRHAVGNYLEIERQSVGFRAGSNLWADVVDLTTGIEAASPPVNVERLQKAIELYRGDFLAGFYVRDAPDFESWAAAERERLRALVIQALYTLADYHTEQGELTQGIASMRRLLSLEPWREEAHRQLMLLLARHGQRSAALAQFETCREILDKELGVAPGEETKILYQHIRNEDLSELLLETQTEQVSGSEFPSAPPHLRFSAYLRHLPPQPTPLIGREEELREVNDLLAGPNCRLVSIVGPGGIGKTRLAVEVARQALAQFADGVYFVSLASTDSAEDIISRIATVLDPEAYPMGRTTVEFLPQLHQSDPALLLVLDNLEQLLPDGGVAIEELLSQTRRLKLIVTSRQALNIRWEWRYDLDGLVYPASNTAEALTSYSAVEMFLQRVQQTRREPLAETEVQAAARICRLVGGMPLGIELAAAQAGRLSCAAIAQALARNLDALVVSLRDLPARQRSLRASFEVTWNSLPAEEQTIFSRLSLFRSSFTAEAAQAVAEAEPLQLINLIDKSLLRQVSPERYDIHEVLRHYAQEKLTEVPDEQAQSLIRYRRYYTTFLHEKTEALQQELDLTENVAEFYSEIDNLWGGWIRVTGQDDAQGFASALVEALQAARYVQFTLIPKLSSHLEHQQQLLESRSSEADVSLIDLIWTDTLADHLLDLSEDFGDEDRTHFSAYIENNMVDGRLVAIPYSTELGLLYYRADLLAKYGFANPPVTWDELELMATEIQAGERAKGRTDFWGFIWPGFNNENLTCIALEWQVSHGGGRLIESEGLITVNNPQSIAAFERAARWVGTISPMTVTEMGLDDEAARKKILAVGNVAFMREWTSFFAEQIDNPKTKDQIGVTMLPSGGAGPAATLGGEQITVSKYARHPQKAINLVRYATSHKAQLQRLVSYPFWAPTIPDLYDQPQLVAVLPHLPKIKEMFSGNIVVRPSKVCGRLYPQVSKAYSTTVHSILTGQVDAATAVAELETTLVEITGFRVGQP